MCEIKEEYLFCRKEEVVLNEIACSALVKTPRRPAFKGAEGLIVMWKGITRPRPLQNEVGGRGSLSSRQQNPLFPPLDGLDLYRRSATGIALDDGRQVKECRPRSIYSIPNHF